MKQSERLDRQTLFLAALGVLIFIFFFYAVFIAKTPWDGFTLRIDFGGGYVRTFRSEYRPVTSTWDILQEVHSEYKIALEAGANFWPRTIGDARNGENGRKWNLYLNGIKKNTSPAQTDLLPGDLVTFKFE